MRQFEGLPNTKIGKEHLLVLLHHCDADAVADAVADADAAAVDR